MHKRYLKQVVIWGLPALAIAGTMLAMRSAPAMAPAAYIQWVENHGNGLRVQEQRGDTLLELQYRPAAYIALWEQKRNPGFTQAQIEERTAQLEALEHFTLRLGTATGEPLGDLTQTAYGSNTLYTYLGGNIREDLQLVSGSDTVTCAMVQWEPMSDLVPYHQLLLAFPKSPSNNEDKELLLNDRLLGLGDVSMTVSAANLNNIPELSIR